MQTTKSTRPQIEDADLVSGGSVPRSGNYTLLHHRHVGSITLLKNDVFPACELCGTAVRYALVSWVSQESASTRFRLLMHTKQTMVIAHR